MTQEGIDDLMIKSMPEWLKKQAYMRGGNEVLLNKLVKEAVKEEREACLKILIEEQKEFAEDRDKQALVYSIAALRARVNE